MTTSTIGLFIRHLAVSEEAKRLRKSSDGDLLAAYQLERGEAAFTELMRRYGPLVLRACSRVLGQGPDAEDVFQATFILLARKAGQLRRETAGSLSLGGWLHRVAYRTALNVVTETARRKAREQQANVMTMRPSSCSDPAILATWNEIQPILDAELDALPERARCLLIACYLQGKTHAEVATELGLAPGSIAWHLQRARTLLAKRLARRGITVSALLLSILLEDSAKGAGVPAVLLVHTVEAARTFTEQAIGMVSDKVIQLVKGGLAQMAKGWTHWSMALAGWVGLLGAGLLACQTLKAWPHQKPQGEPLVVAEQPARQEEKQARTDCFGDPLPPGALARMGTVRLWRRNGWWAGDGAAPAFSPDGQTLATPLDGQTVCLWDAATGKELRRLTTDAHTRNQRYQLSQTVSLSFSPDGKTVALINREGTIYLWEVATGKFLRRQEYQGPKRDKVQCSKMVFLPDGTMLGFGNFCKSVENEKEVREAFVWNVATGKEICQLNRLLTKGELRRENTVFSPDGKVLAAVVDERKEDGTKGIISLWEVATGKKIRQLISEDGVNKVAFSPDGKTLASTVDDKICVWELASGKKSHLLQAEKEAYSGPLTYSPDGKTLLGGRGGHLWDVATGKEIRCFAWQEAAVAVFSPNGKTLAIGDMMGAIRLWEVATGKEIGPRKGYRGSIQWLAYSPDSKTLASLGASIFGRGGDDKVVHLWEAATGKEIRQLAQGSNAFASSPDGKMLASIMDDEMLHLWDTATGKEVRQLRGEGPPTSMTFSPDGKKLAARLLNDSKIDLWVWDIDTGRKICSQLTGNGVPGDFDYYKVESIAFSPDGRVLAVADGKENAVSLWDMATSTRIAQLGGQKQPVRKGEQVFVRFLAFSPDCRILATSSWNEDKVRLWEVASGKEIRQLDAYNQHKAEHSDDAVSWWRGCSLAFSPDGRLLSTAAQERNREVQLGREVRLWEVVSGREIGRLKGHQAPVRTLAFAPDGQTLVSGSDDLTCLIWDVTPFACRLRPVPTRRLPAQPLSKERLESTWGDLAQDPAKAYTAIGTLQAAPEQALSLLQARLRPVAPINTQQLERWIADLDDNSFTRRAKAQREIQKLGEPALPALRQALKNQPSLEMKRRLQDILAGLEPKPVGGSPEHLRELRAVHVLESLGTSEARQLLQALAGGAPGPRLTQEAQAALARLAKRSALKP